MAINPVELEQPIIYNFDELCQQVESKALAAKWTKRNIMFQLSRMGLVSNPLAICDESIAVAEITKDIATHASPEAPRLVILQPEMGGAALHSLSITEPSERREPDEGEYPDLDAVLHNGEKLLEGMYKDDYKLIRGENGEHERHLFIRGRVEVIGDQDISLPQIDHSTAN